MKGVARARMWLSGKVMRSHLSLGGDHRRSFTTLRIEAPYLTQERSNAAFAGIPANGAAQAASGAAAVGLHE
jgi:hypothetical protein